MEIFFNQIKQEETISNNESIILKKITDKRQSSEAVSEFTTQLQKNHMIDKQDEHKNTSLDIGGLAKNNDEQSVYSWDIKNIAKDVASIAKQNLEENGHVYDESTGLYYDHKHQCYYNPEYKLYYYHQTGAYYYYDEDINGLKYYCSAYSETENPSKEGTKIEETPAIESQDVVQDSPSEISGKTNEDSEISEREDVCVPSGPVVIEAGPKSFEPDHSKHIAPCIRILVKSSLASNLCPGTLFMVTCAGGTLGREGNHDVLIPDRLVSDLHSSFRYSYKEGSYFYEVMDMGSKNGTFLNGHRLSDTLVQSDPFEVKHGSIITVGKTDLLCHIHAVYETCEECDAYNSFQETIQEATNELTLKERYCNEVFAIRKKFGIISHNYFSKYPPEYEDRSETRRKTVGSSHPSEKTEVACVFTKINRRNKGFSLLSKMGWVEGRSLGKNGYSILEPINPENNEGKHGLGFIGVPLAPPTFPRAPKKRLAVNKITIERYKDLM